MNGVGGDGFITLLSHSKNIENKTTFNTIDKSGRIKFNKPINRFYNNVFGRHPKTFYSVNKKFNEEFFSMVDADKNIIYGFHPFSYFDHLKLLDKKEKDYLNKNSCRILLYSDNIERVAYDDIVKNETSLDELESKISYHKIRNDVLHKLYNRGIFNFKINIEEFWSNKTYALQKVKDVGLDLEEKYYDQYIEIINLNKTNMV